MSGTDVIRKAADAINRHDAPGLAALYAEDAVVYDPAYAEPLRGRATIEKDMEDFLRAFPDLHNAVQSTLESGDLVAAQFAISGVHKGPLPLPTGEVPATGKKLEFKGGVFSRLNSEGRIVEEHRYYDVLGQLVQLGLTPDAVST